MDVGRVNRVLVWAIAGLQDGELDGLREAAVLGYGGAYEVPSPGELAVKLKRRKSGSLSKLVLDDLLGMGDKEFAGVRKKVVAAYKRGRRPLVQPLSFRAPEMLLNQFLMNRYWDRIVPLRKELAAIQFSARQKARPKKPRRGAGKWPGSGQLWEPCERCGEEPSYMTGEGHLCMRCAQMGRR